MSFFRKRVHHIERLIPAPAAIKRAAELMKAKKRPLIIAGGGVHYSLATDALREFAETFHIPVSETQAGKSAMVWDHELCMGGVGTTGTSAANILAKGGSHKLWAPVWLTPLHQDCLPNEDVDIITINVNRMDGFKMDSEPVLADIARRRNL